MPELITQHKPSLLKKAKEKPPHTTYFTFRISPCRRREEVTYKKLH
jgi:hypothetical protein